MMVIIQRAVLAMAAALAVASVSRVAGADEAEPATPYDATPERAPTPKRWLDTVHRHLAADQLVEADAWLSANDAEGLDPEDRLAAMQLRFVIDAWREKGRIPSSSSGASPAEEEPDDDDNWHLRLARARSRLVAGDYAEAELRLSALVKTAPDERWASAARHLAELAHEVRATHTPSAAPVLFTARRRAARGDWYGWQTLLADGISLVTTPVLVGIGGYFLAPPIVHIAHRQPLRALASLGLRVGLPVGGALIGGTVLQRGRNDTTGALAGGLLGVAGAIVIDAAVLAYEPGGPGRPPPSSTAGTLSPSVGPRPEGGLDLGLRGTF